MSENGKELQKSVGMGVQIVVTDDQKEVIKKTIAPGASDAELELFVYDCIRRGTHPMDRMIFFIPRGQGPNRKVTHQASIDFFRSKSEETGDYAGMAEPEFGEEDENGYPEFCRVTLFRIIHGEKLPFVGVARWKEYYPGETLGHMWRKMPYHMLAKCAEALARRIAFPQQLGGLYTPDEMASVPEKDVTPPAERQSTVREKAAPPAAEPEYIPPDDPPAKQEKPKTETGEVASPAQVKMLFAKKDTSKVPDGVFNDFLKDNGAHYDEETGKADINMLPKSSVNAVVKLVDEYIAL